MRCGCKIVEEQKVTLESQCVDTVRRARQAVEQGQYRKAIQLLSSRALVQASEEIRNEILILKTGCSLKAPSSSYSSTS